MLTFSSPLLCFTLLGAGLSLAANSSCDALCLGELGKAYENAQHAEPNYEFYTVPSNYSSTLAPGSLLRVEPVTNLTNYSVPSSLTMSRLMYTTVDLNGTVIPTSAYVLWPYAPPNSFPSTPSSNGSSPAENCTQSSSKTQGFPLVAWAHGTSGLLPPCSPSNYRNLQYHFQVPFLLALQGMAVVAPDYAGLGVSKLPSGEPINHAWVAGPAQANNLTYAIVAARAAFPDLLPASGPFVSVGHSQGGKTTWAFAEQQAAAGKPLDGYRGTVSIAPPANIFEQISNTLRSPQTADTISQLDAQPMLIAGVTAAFPAYNYSGMTDVSYDRWNNVLKPLGGCLPTNGLVFADVAAPELAKQGWIEDPTVQSFANMTRTGGRKFKGPLLIIGGELDQVVTPEFLSKSVAETCEALDSESEGESLEFVLFTGVNHFPTIQASSIKWLPWVKDRLALTGGETAIKPGCSNSTVHGFRTQYTPQTAAPNFLLEWASSTEQWKYVL